MGLNLLVSWPDPEVRVVGDFPQVAVEVSDVTGIVPNTFWGALVCVAPAAIVCFITSSNSFSEATLWARAKPSKPLPEARAALIERLSARLGEAAIQGLALAAEHRPERAWRYIAPGAQVAGTAMYFHKRLLHMDVAAPGHPWPSRHLHSCASRMSREAGSQKRPLWLLTAPVPLECRDGAPYLDGRLSLQPDRERIESGWWDGGDIRRDYFIARNDIGVRLWVFRELSSERGWFVHGVFG